MQCCVTRAAPAAAADAAAAASHDIQLSHDADMRLVIDVESRCTSSRLHSIADAAVKKFFDDISYLLYIT